MKPVLTIACALVLSMPLCSFAGQITLHFDELPTQDANGVTIGGVTFGFGPSGSSATYNFQGADTQDLTQNLSDPVLEGDTSGILTLSFAYPTPIFSFDIALTTINSVSSAYQVALSYQGSGVFSQISNVTPQVMFAEDFFSYSGTPVDFATITFPNTIDTDGMPVSTFAIDNMTFDPPTSSPEPGVAFLLGGGLLGMGLLARRRRG
jgi:hypothetical protein